MFKRIFFLYSCIMTFGLNAQQSAIYTESFYTFEKALDLFKDEQYVPAQILFDRALLETSEVNTKSDCAYYSASCAIQLNQLGADAKMDAFLVNYPSSIKSNDAAKEVAQYYFLNRNYAKSIEWFDKVDDGYLSQTEKEKIYFQKGYVYFSQKENKKAANYFNKVLNSKDFGSQAKYYLGYMSYETDDYKSANTYFDQVEDQEKYKEKMGYFQADMNFKLGNFKEAIELGKAQLDKSKGAEISELSKIIGESYFNLKDYKNALLYLKKYNGKKGKWNNTDFYQLGYTYYKNEDYIKAIDQFNKIIDSKDFVSQNAYYHLGECYLKNNQKQQALNAFKAASEMDFDAKIKEDSSFNYAKLSYELGNPYQSVPSVLQGFIAQYPKSSFAPEVQKLLISSFVTSKNYKEALELLEKNKTAENKVIYQKVAFYRGLELATDNDTKESKILFEKAIAENKTPLYTARALFWKGESEYNLNQFDTAILSYLQFNGYNEAKTTPEYENFEYNIAYAYFKTKNYAKAIDYFKNFTTKSTLSSERLIDAFLRLGDCYFISAQYWPAMESYNKAIEKKSPDADYAAFQKGISYGFVQKNDKKIEDLNSFMQKYPKSQYADDALYELGNTYVAEGQQKKALASYEKLVTVYINSNYVPKTILKQGLIYYNDNDTTKALDKFKKVAADFPNSAEALEAVNTARLIYIDKGNVAEYAAWVKTLDFIEVSDVELDNATYESAERQYLQNNIKQATSGFLTYLAEFPEGLHALKANFYLGQFYYADDLAASAIKYFEYVVSKPKSEYTEQALVRLCELVIKEKNTTKAISNLLHLEKIADFPQNRTYAQTNLMKQYYENENFSDAVKYAQVVLNDAKVDDRIKLDAQLFIARSAIKTNNEAEAKKAYAALQLTATGALAAEATYYEAYFKNKENKFEASNEVVQTLAFQYSGYKYYASKGLLLMAKNFKAIDDNLNAKVILESLISNFSQFPDVVDDAKIELASLKEEAAKTNSSIQN